MSVSEFPDEADLAAARKTKQEPGGESDSHAGQGPVGNIIARGIDHFGELAASFLELSAAFLAGMRRETLELATGLFGVGRGGASQIPGGIGGGLLNFFDVGGSSATQIASGFNRSLLGFLGMDRSGAADVLRGINGRFLQVRGILASGLER